MNLLLEARRRPSPTEYPAVLSREVTHGPRPAEVLYLQKGVKASRGGVKAGDEVARCRVSSFASAVASSCEQDSRGLCPGA